MGLLRRPPRGWVAGTLVSTRHTVTEFPSHDAEGSGRGEWETSYLLDVTWEVRLPGAASYLIHETRKAPVWVEPNELGGSGRRWYAVRLRKSHGLMVGVPMPCAVDPSDQTGIWIDWDAGYAAHEVAWRRESALDRAVAERRGRFDGLVARVTDPFAGRLDPADQRLVDQRIAAEDAEQQRIHQQYAARAEEVQWGGVPADEKAAFQAMAGDLVRIDQTGRPAPGRIVAVVDTGRVLMGLPVRRMEIEVLDPGPRRVFLELPMQPRIAQRYRDGMAVRLKVDVLDPSKVAVLQG